MQKKYNLAKNYYEKYGNLEIPNKFKTTNGIDYDKSGVALGEWLSTQRQAYKGMDRRKITEEQIRLLENIGINWYNEKMDSKLQSEQITDKNTNRKQKEILNRTLSYLNTYDGQTLPSKEELNEGFIEKLNNVKK